MRNMRNPITDLLATFRLNPRPFKSHPLKLTLDRCTEVERLVEDALSALHAAESSGRFSSKGLADERAGISARASAAVRDWATRWLDNKGRLSDGSWVSPKLAISKLRESLVKAPPVLDSAARIEAVLREHELRLQLQALSEEDRVLAYRNGSAAVRDAMESGIVVEKSRHGMPVVAPMVPASLVEELQQETLEREHPVAFEEIRELEEHAQVIELVREHALRAIEEATGLKPSGELKVV